MQALDLQRRWYTALSPSPYYHIAKIREIRDFESFLLQENKKNTLSL